MAGGGKNRVDVRVEWKTQAFCGEPFSMEVER
jgi:hypothetical protein